MLYKLAGHERDIVGGGEVRAVIKQSAAIGEVRVLKPKLLRALVHALDKLFLAAAYVLRHSDRAVVCRDDRDAFEHIADAHLLPGFEVHAAAAEGCRAFACDDRVIKLEPAGLDILHNEQHRHDLRDACRKAGFMGVLLI